MKKAILYKSFVPFLILLFCSVLLAGQSWAALPSKKAKAIVAATSVIPVDNIKPAESVSSVKDHRHLSFFRKLKVVREVMKARKMRANSGDGTLGVVSLGLAGVSLLSYALLLLLAASGGLGLFALFLLSFFSGVAAIITGAIGIGESKNRSLAIAGMVIGIVEVSAVLLFTIIALLLISAL